jgi:hypothetical protein
MNGNRSIYTLWCFSALFWLVWPVPPTAALRAATVAKEHLSTTYYVDCKSVIAAGNGSLRAPLRTISSVNALFLQPGDRVLFKRGSACSGELTPQGSGTTGAPIRVGSYGKGSLPQIAAAPTDAAAFRLFNQSFWEIHSLDLKGGRKYGFFAGGDGPAMHHLYLRDLCVHDVGGGPLQHKESGLVVIAPSGTRTTIDDVDLNGILAANTTQWSGIFVSRASHVRVRNSVVHDVQGDGIVVFESHDAVIAHSLAWHTGMQLEETIGTPNAIWTWRCTECTVEENEAFLTDSPGGDGGSFDIDYGNTRNTVERNFGHDTMGYCVAVFGAFGTTTDSVVANNLCLDNDMSPRLAEGQGAIFLMTWEHGVLNGVTFHGNQIDWQPPGEMPAVKIGSDLQATGITIDSNEIWSTGTNFIDRRLKYAGERNRYVVASGDPLDMVAAQQQFATLAEKDSTIISAPSGVVRTGLFGSAPTNTVGWKLIVAAPANMLRDEDDDSLREMLVEMMSAASQFGHVGLTVKLVGSRWIASLAKDWDLPEDGVKLELQPANKVTGFSVKVISPNGQIVRAWRSCPSPVELGLLLRQNIGRPDFSFLPFENMPAKN